MKASLIRDSDRIVWCDGCRKYVSAIVHKTRRNGSAHGIRYRYRGKKANCSVCGCTINLPDIMMYNFRKLIMESKKEKYKENEYGK